MKKYKMLFLNILITFFGISRVQSSNQVFGELEHFLIDNGHRYVDIIHNFSSTQTNWVSFRPKTISIARLKIGNVYKPPHEAFGIFVFEDDKDDIQTILRAIVQRKVKMSLLLCTKPIRNGESALMKQLNMLSAVGLFYMAIINPTFKTSWYQIMSLETGTVVEDLTFVNNSFLILESYNLQGLQIRSTTLTWAPFLTINDCNEMGLECKTNYGYLKDYMDLLARRFNFTYISHRNTENDWGVIPKKGPHNINGTWGGVMGNVINKKYDMSISTWYWKLDRVELVQMVPVVRGRMILVSAKQKPKTDFGLLSRGFNNASWMGIFILLVIVHICIFISKLVGPNGHKESLKIMVFSMALLFVMIRAYYSAALTKFFTVAIPQPFETERDVIRAYPSWDFMIRKGEEASIYSYVLQGDADYINFWQRYIDNPEATMYQSDKEALQHITNGKCVISSSENQFLGYLKSNAIHEKLHIFGHGRWKYDNLMFHLNSPLVPMFKLGVGHFREQGMESQLYFEWIGVGYNEGSSLLSMTVLTPGQVVMAFTFILSIYMLSLLVLGVEVLTRKIKPSNLSTTAARRASV